MHRKSHLYKKQNWTEDFGKFQSEPYLLKTVVARSKIAMPAGGRKKMGVAMTMRVRAVVRIALRAAKCETPALVPSSLYTSTPE